MKKIIILGANSYIARNVLFYLKSTQEKLDISLYDYAPAHLDGEENYSQLNILSKDEVSRIDFSCDVIFMFVGKTGSANGFDDYKMFIEVNENALLNVLHACKQQASGAKIVFPSTRLVYKGKKGILLEDSEKEFKTVYAINKFSCETYLKQFHDVFGLNYVIFRICIPYGTMIPNVSSYGTAEFMLSKATAGQNISLYGDGSVRRTLTYIYDLCKTLVEGAFCNECCNDVYNIGGENYSLKEMATIIAHKYAVGIDYVDWPEIALKIESGDTVFDDSKLVAVIGKTCNTSFEAWITNTQ